MRPRMEIICAAVFFLFMYSAYHTALRSFLSLAGWSAGERDSLHGFAIMALEHVVVFQKPKSLDSLRNLGDLHLCELI
jgi:hypothetical protein